MIGTSAYSNYFDSDDKSIDPNVALTQIDKTFEGVKRFIKAMFWKKQESSSLTKSWEELRNAFVNSVSLAPLENDADAILGVNGIDDGSDCDSSSNSGSTVSSNLDDDDSEPNVTEEPPQAGKKQDKQYDTTGAPRKSARTYSARGVEVETLKPLAKKNPKHPPNLPTSMKELKALIDSAVKEKTASIVAKGVEEADNAKLKLKLANDNFKVKTEALKQSEKDAKLANRKEKALQKKLEDAEKLLKASKELPVETNRLKSAIAKRSVSDVEVLSIASDFTVPKSRKSENANGVVNKDSTHEHPFTHSVPLPLTLEQQLDNSRGDEQFILRAARSIIADVHDFNMAHAEEAREMQLFELRTQAVRFR
jgi:hypothetical protein